MRVLPHLVRLGIAALLAAAALPGCAPPSAEPGPGGPDPETWESRRLRMVEQVRDRGVTDPGVLEAMEKVERHRFVPWEVMHEAFEQKPLPIGEAQTISSPYIVARMTELLELDGSEKALEIGTGSGYQAAILSELVSRVHTIEILETLADRARGRLRELGYENVVVWCRDGYQGLPGEAPFDAIIVTAAPPELPEELVTELAPGGRMVVPIGERDGNQVLTLIRKDGSGRVTEERVDLVKFVPMVHEE